MQRQRFGYGSGNYERSANNGYGGKGRSRYRDDGRNEQSGYNEVGRFRYGRSSSRYNRSEGNADNRSRDRYGEERRGQGYRLGGISYDRNRYGRGRSVSRDRGSDGRCFLCGDLGHWARECSRNTGLCFRCGKDGHFARDCEDDQDFGDVRDEGRRGDFNNNGYSPRGRGFGARGRRAERVTNDAREYVNDGHEASGFDSNRQVVRDSEGNGEDLNC